MLVTVDGIGCHFLYFSLELDLWCFCGRPGIGAWARRCVGERSNSRSLLQWPPWARVRDDMPTALQRRQRQQQQQLQQQRSRSDTGSIACVAAAGVIQSVARNPVLSLFSYVRYLLLYFVEYLVKGMWGLWRGLFCLDTEGLILVI